MRRFTQSPSQKSLPELEKAGTASAFQLLLAGNIESNRHIPMETTNPIPPLGAVFNPEFLSNLKFGNRDQAEDYLKALAIRNGFELSVRSSDAAGFRMYCHRGDFGHGEKTTKTGCQVHLSVRRHVDCWLITPNSVLEHNHEPLPFKPEALPKELEDHVKVMASIGIGRPAISHFLHEVTGEYPTASQLASFFTPDRPYPDQSQTEGLIELIHSQGGETFTKETVEAGQTVRAAVFTATPQERRNLESLGDVLFLDGTAIRNELGWTTYPVGLLDESNHIVSGGLLFTAFERQEIFHWFLHLFIEFLGEQLRTIFTDEDLAMMATMEVLKGEYPRVRHRLCSWHKKNNFEKRVRAVTRDDKVVKAAMGLFNIIISEPAARRVDHAFEQMRALLPQLDKYIEDELWDLRFQLTEAYRGDAVTLGRRSNQAGESNNRMLRKVLAPGARTLADIREAYTQAHTIKCIATMEVVSRSFVHKHFTETAFQLHLTRYVTDWIDRLVNESKLWVCIPLDEPDRFQATCHERFWQIAYDGEHLPECECNETSGTGLPCCHIIALFWQLGGRSFPTQLITARWIPNFEGFTMPPLPPLTLAESDVVQKILSEASSGDEEEGPPSPASPDESDLIRAGRDGATRKYNRIMMIAKEIAQRASANAERYDEVLREMETVRDSLLSVDQGEIRDASGKPKGRPRGSGHSRPDPAGPTHCPLCRSDAHNLPDCGYHPLFRKAQKKFVPRSGGKIMCPLCSFRGHRACGCPVLQMAREMIVEKNPRRKKRTPVE